MLYQPKQHENNNNRTKVDRSEKLLIFLPIISTVHAKSLSVGQFTLLITQDDDTLNRLQKRGMETEIGEMRRVVERRERDIPGAGHEVARDMER